MRTRGLAASDDACHSWLCVPKTVDRSNTPSMGGNGLSVNVQLLVMQWKCVPGQSRYSILPTAGILTSHCHTIRHFAQLIQIIKILFSCQLLSCSNQQNWTSLGRSERTLISWSQSAHHWEHNTTYVTTKPASLSFPHSPNAALTVSWRRPGLRAFTVY